MGLYRLIYASRAQDPSIEDLRAILAACERNNPAAHLTGMLLFDAGAFVQLLEGPRGPLTRRFVAIAGDLRHHGVEILTAGPIESRIFPDWSMHYAGQAGAHGAMLKRYSCGPHFDPFAMTPGAVEQMCLEVSAMALSALPLAAAG